MNYEKIYKTLITVLMAMAGFFLAQTYNKLCVIETDLVTVKLQLQKLQSEQITADRVKDICRYEIYRYHGQIPGGHND